VPFANLDKFDAVLGANADLFTHSSSEKAIGKWVGGQTIYRKSFDITATPIASFNHGIAGITAVLGLRFMIKDAAASWRPLPWLYSGSDSNWIGGVYVTSTQVVVQYQVGSPTIQTGTRIFAVIEYLK